MTPIDSAAMDGPPSKDKKTLVGFPHLPLAGFFREYIFVKV